MENEQFDQIMSELMKKAAKANNEDPENAEGIHHKHHTRIQKLLKEDKSEDIIIDTYNHEQYVVSRSEQYACVQTGQLAIHYGFNKDFSEIEYRTVR